MSAPEPRHIPEFLIKLPCWVLWRTEQRRNPKTGEVTKTKPPISCRTGKNCDVTDPGNLVEFTKVDAALRKSSAWDGYGFALGPVEHLAEIIIGLDLDACIDADGATSDWAMQFLIAANSYAERSPGGGGIKCVARIRLADLPIARKLLGIAGGDKEQARTRSFGPRPPNGGHAPTAQLFLTKRYFTITGQHWMPSPKDVRLLSVEDLALLGTLFGPNQQRGSTTTQRHNGAEAAIDDETEPDDAALRGKLSAELARNARLRERWNGSTEGLSDTTRSGIDMSVVALLKAAGFIKGETLAALRLFEHGKVADEPPRYFERMWARSKAAPHVNPEPLPGPEPEPGPRPELPPPKPEPPSEPKPKPTIWPEPIDLFTVADRPPPDVTEDETPPALWSFIKDTAERMGVAKSTVALCCIVACSSVISDEWEVQPKANDWSWTECARLWGAVVGPPSILKTPVIRAATKAIDRLEIEAEKQWTADMDRWREDHKAWKEADDGSPEPQRPPKPRYLVESSTIEALQEVLRTDGDARFIAPAGKVMVRQDELSEFLANLDRYHSGRQGGDRGAYLRLWNGGRYVVDRIGRGAFSSNNWSGCLLGSIQPEPIQQIAKQSADDGLLQRILFDVPSPHPGGGEDRTPDRDALDRYHRLIPALTALHPPPDMNGQLQTVKLHRDAQLHRRSVEALARSIAAMPDTSRQLQSALGKWPGYFARLCLTFHLIGIADAKARGEISPPMMVVSADTAAMVEGCMRNVLLPHLLRAYTLMFATVQTGHAKWIAGHILAHGSMRITVRDVVRAYIQLRAPEARDELHSVMASLVAIGWLDPEPRRNPLADVSTWRVNPAVHTLFAARAEREREERERRARETVERRQTATATTAQGGESC
jgi:hypothetical protein